MLILHHREANERFVLLSIVLEHGLRLTELRLMLRPKTGQNVPSAEEEGTFYYVILERGLGTLHFKKEKLSTNSSREFNSVLDTINHY